MRQLFANWGQEVFSMTDEAQISFENINYDFCEAEVFGMPTENGMFVMDTDAAVFAISGILHQE